MQSQPIENSALDLEVYFTQKSNPEVSNLELSHNQDESNSYSPEDQFAELEKYIGFVI